MPNEIRCRHAGRSIPGEGSINDRYVSEQLVDHHPCRWMLMAGSTSSEPARPASRRRMAALVCGAFGAIFLAAALIIGLWTDAAIEWAAFLAIFGVIGVLFAGFVWVRMSE